MPYKLSNVPISVLIPTYNEIANIVPCIKSVLWASEIVVVDSASTDGTVQVAKELGAMVVNFEWNFKYPKKKNWALENLPWKNEWVLILDADERVTPELAVEIEQAVRNTGMNGYFVNRKFMFMGNWLKHSGYYPSWNLRLFRHKLGRYEWIEGLDDTGSGDNEVHEHVILKRGLVAYLRQDMLHYAYPSIAVWVEKHNRYSSWEAHLMRASLRKSNSLQTKSCLLNGILERKRWLKRLAFRLPFRPTIRFLYHFVFKLGFLDGRSGYILARLMAFYEFLSLVKAKELQINLYVKDSNPEKESKRSD